nr:MAG TPA_asm: hypothetical protein [Bacteriophage sp.]
MKSTTWIHQVVVYSSKLNILIKYLDKWRAMI